MVLIRVNEWCPLLLVDTVRADMLNNTLQLFIPSTYNIGFFKNGMLPQPNQGGSSCTYILDLYIRLYGYYYYYY